VSDACPIRNYQNEGDALSPLLFNFSLGYAIRKVQEENGGITTEWDIKAASVLLMLIYWMTT
jgi:hypothetical protein